MVDYKAADAIIKSPEWAIKFGSEPRQRRNVLEQAAWLRQAAQLRKRLTPEFHEVWLACANELRRLADSHEYTAMADLHVNRKKSWDQVRAALGVQKSRQALAKRWDRFTQSPAGDWLAN